MKVWGFEGLGLKGFRVLRFQDFRVLGFQDFTVSERQGFKASDQGSRVTECDAMVTVSDLQPWAARACDAWAPGEAPDSPRGRSLPPSGPPTRRVHAFHRHRV